jgi:hypothetical protein
MNQAASDSWQIGDEVDKVFSNSTIEPTLRGFKKTDSEALKVKYETSMRGVDTKGIQTLNCTYNQVMNIPYEDLAEFDYLFK